MTKFISMTNKKIFVVCLGVCGDFGVLGIFVFLADEILGGGEICLGWNFLECGLGFLGFLAGVLCEFLELVA